MKLGMEDEISSPYLEEIGRNSGMMGALTGLQSKG